MAVNQQDDGRLLTPLKRGIGCDNPVLCQALGVCSALAVTGFVSTTLVMCASLLFVATLSTAAVSLLRNITPHRVRLMMQMLVISTLVIVVSLYLQAYWYDLSKSIMPYITLIITNCLILGRCEAFAMRNGPVRSAIDGAGAAAGYSFVLLAISLVREPLGTGTLLGWPIMPESFTPIRLVAEAPGAFLAMGIVVWVVKSIWPGIGFDQQPEAE